MAAQRWLKTIEKFKSPALKVVTVVYGRWSLTRGFDYGGLTGRNCCLFHCFHSQSCEALLEVRGASRKLVFWKSGHLLEVVANGGSTVLY